MPKLRVKLKTKPSAKLHVIDPRRIDFDILAQAERVYREALSGELAALVSVKIYCNGAAAYVWAGLSDRNLQKVSSEVGLLQFDLNAMRAYRADSGFFNAWMEGQLP